MIRKKLNMYINIYIYNVYEIIWGYEDSHGRVTLGPASSQLDHGQAPRAPCRAGKDPFGEVADSRYGDWTGRERCGKSTRKVDFLTEPMHFRHLSVCLP